MVSESRPGVGSSGFISTRRPRRRSAEQFQETESYLANYPMDDLRTAARIVYPVAANWKAIVENYNECYHCGPVHPELVELVPAFKSRGGSDLDWEHGIPHRDGCLDLHRERYHESTPVSRAFRGGGRASQGTAHLPQFDAEPLG